MSELENLRIIEDFKTNVQDIRLYLDGEDNLVLTLNKFVQFKEGKEDEVYHRNLVDVAIDLHYNPKTFLILGGGDGLCARNILKKVGEPEITLVDFDSGMVDFCRRDSRIIKINEGSLDKCTIYYQDAIKWVKENNKLFDIIILDLPDATSPELKQLYTKSFYSDVINHLNDKGIISIQAHPKISSDIGNIIKDILGNSIINIFPFFWLDEGSVVIGKYECNL